MSQVTRIGLFALFLIVFSCTLLLAGAGTERAYAEIPNTITGNCGLDSNYDYGDNITYTLTTDGTLTLTGTGAMATTNEFKGDWGASGVPWYDYRADIKKVVIGEGITEIGWWAFAHTSITSVELPSTVQTLGQGAFASCYSLTSVTLNDGLESIEGSVFRDDSKLSSLTIPATVKEIHALFIKNCPSLQDLSKITIQGPNPQLKIQDGMILSADGSTLFMVSRSKKGACSIPYGVTTIAEYAAYECPITSVEIPSTVTTIYGRAFYDTNITSVEIPDSVTTLEYGVFGECGYLKTATIGNGVTILETAVFDQCEILSSVTFGNRLKEIGDGTFRYCSSLTSVTLPASVETIGDDAFGACTALATVNLNEGLKTIGDEAFLKDSSLTSITIPSTVTSIGTYAFAECTGLTSIVVPPSVTSIGSDAFPPTAQVSLPSGLVQLEDGSYISSSKITTFTYKVKYQQSSARSMLSKVNAFRTGSNAWYWDSDGNKTWASGLSALTYDYNLEKAAMQRAAEVSLSFSHTRPDGSNCFTVIDSYGSYSGAGENIAAGSSTAQGAFEQWLEENEDYSGQGHRRNMLGSGFNAIGIAHVEREGFDYWVMELGYTDTPNTVATAANNDTETLQQMVYNEDVQYAKGVKQPRLDLVKGKKTALPSTVQVKFSMEETWGDYITATVPATWASTNSKLIQVSDNTAIAKKKGITSLTTQAFGKTISRSATSCIYPVKSTKIKKISRGRKALTVKWAKRKGNVKGYQIQYAKKKSMKKAKKKLVKSAKKTKLTISKLKAKKRYFVRVRTYTTYHGKKYYSAWSKIKSAKTKR